MAARRFRRGLACPGPSSVVLPADTILANVRPAHMAEKDTEKSHKYAHPTIRVSQRCRQMPHHRPVENGASVALIVGCREPED